MNALLRPAVASIALAALFAMSACTPAPSLEEDAAARLPPSPASANVGAIDPSSLALLQNLAERVARLEQARKDGPLPPAAMSARHLGAPVMPEGQRPSEAELRAGPPGGGSRDAQQQEHERKAALDGRFRQEPVNAAWASANALALRQAVQAPVEGGGMAVQGLECRSQTCRVDVGVTDAEALRHGLPQLAQRLAERFPALYVVTRHDGSGATLYFGH